VDIKKLDRYLFIIAAVLLAGFIVVRVTIKKAGEEQKVTLTFTHFLENGPEHGALAFLVEEFEKQNPEIRIRLNIPSPGAPGGAGEPREGGDTLSADVVIFDEGRYNSFLQQDRLASLNSYAHSGQKVIPLISFMDLLFYNIDLLKTAGFDRPPKTREEFIVYAKAVTGGQGTRSPGSAEPPRTAGASGAGKIFGAALAFSPQDPRSVQRDFFSWIRASGTPVIRDGRPDFRIRAVTETLEFLEQLNRERLLSPGTFNKTGTQKTGEFAQGNIALMIGSVEDIPFLRERMGDSAFGVTLIPGPAGYTGKPVIGTSFWYAGISGSCQYPDEAWAFLSFLAEKSPLLAAQARAVPGSGNNPGNYIEDDPLYAKAWDIYEAADVIRDFSGFPRTDDLETIIREELAALFEGKTKAAETAAAIQRRWEAALKSGA
jgi:multiple sugar transport system substrate-binding protein